MRTCILAAAPPLTSSQEAVSRYASGSVYENLLDMSNRFSFSKSHNLGAYRCEVEDALLASDSTDRLPLRFRP
jgi:hypothetical protein